MSNGLTGIKDIIRKKAVKNGIWLYVLQFVNTILPLFTLPYITRILGEAEYGVFSIALNLSLYLQVVVEYGFALSATRKVALAEEEADLSKLFTGVISARFLLYLASLILTAFYVLFAGQSREENLCLIILSVSLIGYVLQENWIFQGKQEMKFISIPSIIARLATTAAVFIFVKSAEDIILYCILYSLSPIISNAVGTFIAVRRYKLRLLKFNIQTTWEAIKDGANIFFTQISSKVFSAIGVTFLGIFATDATVGIYSALYKIPYILMLCWSPISQVVYPISSKKIMDSFEDGLKFIKSIGKKCLILFFVIAVLVGIFAKPIASVAFGANYAEYFYIIYPLLIWLLLGIFNNFVGIQSMVGSGHDKEYNICFQIGVATTIILNFVLIYFFGMIGASLAVAISEAVLTVLLVLRLRKIKKKMIVEGQ